MNEQNKHIQRGKPPETLTNAQEIKTEGRNASVNLQAGDWIHGTIVSVRMASARNVQTNTVDNFPVYEIRDKQDGGIFDLPAGRWDLREKLAHVAVGSEIFVGCKGKVGRSFVHSVRVIATGNGETLAEAQAGEDETPSAEAFGGDRIPF